VIEFFRMSASSENEDKTLTDSVNNFVILNSQ
jgi:hypothetical protein